MRQDTWADSLSWWSCQSPVVYDWTSDSLNSLRGGIFKLNAKFDADPLVYLLSHFECNGHTVHMLTQWHTPPPLTSTVKSSLFTHVHSSSFSLAARLHGCRTNCSHYINNDWTSSGQTKHVMHRWQTQGPGAESSPLPSFMQPGTLFLPCGSTKLSLYC